MKEIQEAIICFKKAIQINPNNPDAHNNIGNLFKEKGQIEEAENCYRKAIKINPEYANAITILEQYLKNTKILMKQ